MARLVMLDAGGRRREFELKPGISRIGRTEQNDFQIPDPTVSGCHCEIELGHGVAFVRDLDSTNGTFVNAVPVQQTTLQHGQVLRLGAVELVYEEDHPRPVESAPVSERTPAAVTSGAPAARQPIRVVRPRAEPAQPPVIRTQPSTGHMQHCGRHPGVPAKWICVGCHSRFCENCVKVTKAGVHQFHSCPACGGSCMTEQQFNQLLPKSKATFFSLFPSAFAYPLTKGGLILLVLVTTFLGFFEIAKTVLEFAGMMFIYLLCIVMSIGYLFAFLQNIVLSSAHGEDKMPDLPELSGFWDGIFVPFLRLVLICGACLAPGFLVLVLVSPLAGTVLLVLGFACVPMAMLAVSLADSIGGLNPLVILSAIAKVPMAYFLTCIVFLAAIAVRVLSQRVLDLVPVPVLPIIVGTFIGLYGLTVGMRLLGLLYYTNREKLAWFE